MRLASSEYSLDQTERRVPLWCTFSSERKYSTAGSSIGASLSSQFMELNALDIWVEPQCNPFVCDSKRLGYEKAKQSETTESAVEEEDNQDSVSAGCISDLKNNYHITTDPIKMEILLQPARISKGSKMLRLKLKDALDMRNWLYVLQMEIDGANIPECDLDVSNEMLGSGSSGDVRIGHLNSGLVAVKVLKTGCFSSEKEKEEFYHELAIMSRIRHPNVTRLFGYSIWQGRICAITEMANQGDLYRLIHETDVEWTIERRMRIALAISGGMTYLHNQGIIHRDLKPQNVLIDNVESSSVRVCDFGLSGIKDQEQERTFGTEAYAAPELCETTHTNMVDVYSFAILLWEMTYRKHPWEGCKPMDIVNRRIQGIRPALQGDLMDPVIAICWSSDPLERPPFKEIAKTLDVIRQRAGIALGSPTGSHHATILSTSCSAPDLGSSFVRAMPTLQGATTLEMTKRMTGPIVPVQEKTRTQRATFML
ncbi:serine/threonine protein kinase 2, CTR2 [Planoprotostelium fungivorum]|uniref:Serine/threonine protein kinase 2, CTR2 n=1 Tax=Planoprotostelium fungivorum TaxID=1890364 RepID=A0A2P6NBI2_9EUKA|nr:serine/threonine protein kinase 2, CTR2 [Planoprotostelium fungivorum]